jgi:hypothetical protein
MTPQDAHRLVGQGDIVERLQQPLGVSMFAKTGDLIADMDAQRTDAAAEIERLRSLIPDLSDHAAIDAIAERAGLHRGTVAKVIEAMRRA